MGYLLSIRFECLWWCFLASVEVVVALCLFLLFVVVTAVVLGVAVVVVVVSFFCFFSFISGKKYCRFCIPGCCCNRQPSPLPDRLHPAPLRSHSRSA